MRKLSVFLFMLAFACTKKEEPMVISDPAIELKYDGKHQYTLKKGTETIANSSIQWKSSDEKVGTIDADGLFKGRKIGKTEVSAFTDDGTVKATVEIVPYSNLTTEPVLDFGLSKQSIKSKEKRKLFEEDTNILIYEGENSKVEYAMYLFEDNRLTFAAIVFASATGIATESVTFYKERYPLSGLVDGEIMFMDDKKTVSIILTVDDTFGLIAGYVPNESGKRVKGTAKNFDEIRKKLQQYKSKS